MTPKTILFLCCLPLCRLPLTAQSATPEPGLLSVVRGSDGTEVFVDSASVTRSGDSTFVLSTVTKFPAAVGSQRQADLEVETSELDCGRDRTRGIAWGLYLRDQPVSGDTAASAWKPVEEEWLPVSRAICGVLLASFAALPVEREADAAETRPELVDPDEVNRLIHHHGFPGRGRWAGVAVVRFRIGTDGLPDLPRARVVWASRPEFAAAALYQLSVSRYTPARVNGVAVPVWGTLGASYSVTCGNDPGGADQQRATLRRTRNQLVCAY
jgi:hypothetical protein